MEALEQHADTQGRGRCWVCLLRSEQSSEEKLKSEVRYGWQNRRRLRGRTNNRRERGRSLHAPLTQKCDLKSYVKSPNRIILWPEQKVVTQGKTKGTHKYRWWWGLSG